METKKHKIIIYSTSTCPHCVQAKKFLKEHGIEFKDINVQENKEKAKEMVEKSGQIGVPVIDIDGEIVVGFDKEKLKRLLDI